MKVVFYDQGQFYMQHLVVSEDLDLSMFRGIADMRTKVTGWMSEIVVERFRFLVCLIINLI